MVFFSAGQQHAFMLSIIVSCEDSYCANLLQYGSFFGMFTLRTRLTRKSVCAMCKILHMTSAAGAVRALSVTPCQCNIALFPQYLQELNLFLITFLFQICYENLNLCISYIKQIINVYSFV